MSIESEILETEDKNRLYEIKLELNQDISELHKKKALCQTKMEEIEVMGEMKNTYALLQVCEEKIDDWRDTQGRLNYNFRMAAKSILPKQDYNNIMELASMRRGEAKSIIKAAKAS